MITGFQHIGMGAHDVDRTYDFWRQNLGFKMKLNDHTGIDEQMNEIFGEPSETRMLMAMNVGGGGAIEIVRHTSGSKEPEVPIEWGDIGVLDVGLKVSGLDEVYRRLQGCGVEFLMPVRDTGIGVNRRFTYLRDPDGLLVQLIEDPYGKRPRVSGVVQVTIGVRDLERSVKFYREVLGFEDLAWETGELEGMDEVTGGRKTKAALVRQPFWTKSTLPVLEPGQVRLVETPGYEGRPTFEGRRWGDIGCMEFALDVDDVKSTYEGMLARGAEPYQGPTLMDMGSGSVGSFAYVKDPDGNTVEMVEVSKVMFLPPSAMRNMLSLPMKAAGRVGIL